MYRSVPTLSIVCGIVLLLGAAILGVRACSSPRYARLSVGELAAGASADDLPEWNADAAADGGVLLRFSESAGVRPEFVRLRLQSYGEPSRDVTARDSISAMFDGLRPGRWHVWANDERQPSSGATYCESVDIRPGSWRDLEFELPGNRSFSGRLHLKEDSGEGHFEADLHLLSPDSPPTLAGRSRVLLGQTRPRARWSLGNRGPDGSRGEFHFGYLREGDYVLRVSLLHVSSGVVPKLDIPVRIDGLSLELARDIVFADFTH